MCYEEAHNIAEIPLSVKRLSRGNLCGSLWIVLELKTADKLQDPRTWLNSLLLVHSRGKWVPQPLLDCKVP